MLLPSELALKTGAGSGAYDSPPVVSKRVTKRRDNVDVASAFGPDGLISNWDHFDALFGYSLHNSLGLNNSSHAVLYSEPNHNGRAGRERLAELLFEKYELPALYLARSAVLAAYANGRTTGIVLDVGHSGSSAVPVVEGTITKERIVRTPVGGRTVREAMGALLAKRQVRLRPLWSFNSKVTRSDDGEMVLSHELSEVATPNVTPSFYKCAREAIIEEITASIARVREQPVADSTAPLPSAALPYELPDGQTVDLGSETLWPGESTLFGKLPHISGQSAGSGDTRPSHVAAFAAQLAGGGAAAGAQIAGSDGLHGLVLDALRRCDAALHRDLLAGVCLTGGVSDMNGLFDRLSVGLLRNYHKVRVLAATGSHERKYCAWTGGSILATFSEFQKSWFSRSEYEENGTAFIHRKCP